MYCEYHDLPMHHQLTSVLGPNSNSTSSSGRSGKVKKGRRGKNVVGESVGDDEYVRENIRKSQAVQNIIKKALKSNFVFDKLPESTHKDFSTSSK